jgi:DNA-binding transcriptional MerR regulator
MRMEKRKFRIGELAKHLAVERFVIRFWEKEFNVKSTRSGGGQRFYDEDDARTFATIKELLYNRGFTIAGARKELPHLRGARLLSAQGATELKEIKQVASSSFAKATADMPEGWQCISINLNAFQSLVVNF